MPNFQAQLLHQMCLFTFYIYTQREGFKNPSHGICPLGGYPPPLLNGRENLAKKVNGKGGYSPPPIADGIFSRN